MGKVRRRNSISDLVHGHLAPGEALRLLNEVEKDPELTQELEGQIGLLNLIQASEMRELLKANIVESSRPRGRPLRLVRAIALLGLTPRRTVFAATAAMALLVMWGSIHLFKSGVESNVVFTALEGENLALRLRSYSETDLAVAADQIAEGEFQSAAERLERFVRMNSQSELSLWAEHVAGLIRIKGARRTVLGIGGWVDQEEVRKGIEHLRSVEGRLGILEAEEEGLWYQGMGRLLLGEYKEAEVAMKKVLEMSGSRASSARGVLDRLYLK